MRHFFSILFILTLLSCEDRDDKLFRSQLRLENKTSQRFAKVTIGTQRLVFEEVMANSFSPYQTLDTLYFLDTVVVASDSTLVSFVPDSLGLPLPRGLFTYQMSFDNNDSLQLELRID